jgi:uncharacterized protein YegL
MARPVTGGIVITLPVYLVVDTSASLMGDIDAVNQALAELLYSLRREPILADRVRVAVIQFSSDAREVLPLTEIDRLESLPILQAGGATDYGAAFSLVRRLIPRDVEEL